MVDFLNSVGLQTLIELVAGLVVLMVYWMQRVDKLRSAAASILLEIQQAEKAAGRVKDFIRSGDLDVNAKILQSDSWDEYKHLFLKVLDTDEYEAITDFYANARLLDESIDYAKACFRADVEQIRLNRQRIFTDFMKDAIYNMEGKENEKNAAMIALMQDRINLFDRLHMGQQPQHVRYDPNKVYGDAQRALGDFEKLSTTSVGQKLKVLSKRKFRMKA